MPQTDLSKLLNLDLAEKPAEAAKPSQNEMFAQSLLALAPILAGAAVGGAQGGAAGAEAGMTGLKSLAESKRLEKEAMAKAEDKRKSDIMTAIAWGKEQRAEERQLAELGLSKRRLEIEAAKAAKEKEPSGPQFLAGTYARRLEQAEQVFDNLQSGGFNRAATKERLASVLPAELQSSARVANDQAERNFVNSILRRESGAAISAAEYKNAEQQYFPRPGDSSDVIAQKKANRLQAMAGLQAEAGRALEKVPLVNVPMMAKQAAQPGAAMGVQNAEAAAPSERQQRILELRKQLGK